MNSAAGAVPLDAVYIGKRIIIGREIGWVYHSRGSAKVEGTVPESRLFERPNQFEATCTPLITCMGHCTEFLRDFLTENRYPGANSVKQIGLHPVYSTTARAGHNTVIFTELVNHDLIS